MQIKSRDSIGTFLKQSAASNPATSWSEATDPSALRSRAAPPRVAAPTSAGPSDRIVAYLGEHGASPVASIVTDLGLGLDDALVALERLEIFGFVTLDRQGEKVTVALAS